MSGQINNVVDYALVVEQMRKRNARPEHIAVIEQMIGKQEGPAVSPEIPETAPQLSVIETPEMVYELPMGATVLEEGDSFPRKFRTFAGAVYEYVGLTSKPHDNELSRTGFVERGAPVYMQMGEIPPIGGAVYVALGYGTGGDARLIRVSGKLVGMGPKGNPLVEEREEITMQAVAPEAPAQEKPQQLVLHIPPKAKENSPFHLYQQVKRDGKHQVSPMGIVEIEGRHTELVAEGTFTWIYIQGNEMLEGGTMEVLRIAGFTPSQLRSNGNFMAFMATFPLTFGETSQRLKGAKVLLENDWKVSGE